MHVMYDIYDSTCTCSCQSIRIIKRQSIRLLKRQSIRIKRQSIYTYKTPVHAYDEKSIHINRASIRKISIREDLYRYFTYSTCKIHFTYSTCKIYFTYRT